LLFIVLFSIITVVKRFRSFGILTILAIIALIFIGGLVRATGSGMGCPDWPKCFGRWVPPTHINQLPINYATLYGAKLKGEVIFNPIKTWIEYVNRLCGVLVGIFVLLTFFFSLKCFKSLFHPIVLLSFISFILICVEGWLGSKVVSSELNPNMVTWHMLLSILILAILILAILKSFSHTLYQSINYQSLSFLLLLAMFFMIGQIVFGTQLREGIDAAQKALGEERRSEWVNTIFGKVIFHGGFSFIILFLHFFLFLKIKLLTKINIEYKVVRGLLLCTVFSVLTGVFLSFAGFSAFLQPFHLVFSVIIISLQFVLYFLMSPKLIQ
jgi:heme a synthase